MSASNTTSSQMNNVKNGSEPVPKQKSTKELCEEYLNGLDEKQALIFKIAEEHMESSYDVSRSNGFIDWLKTNFKKE